MNVLSSHVEKKRKKCKMREQNMKSSVFVSRDLNPDSKELLHSPRETRVINVSSSHMDDKRKESKIERAENEVFI